MANSKRKFVWCDQVSLHLSFTVKKIGSFTLVLPIRIVLDCFYLLIFYFKKIILNLSLPFNISHKHEPKSLYYLLTFQPYLFHQQQVGHLLLLCQMMTPYHMPDQS